MLGFYEHLAIHLMFISAMTLLDVSTGSNVCSTTDNPCMSPMESGNDWNFLNGLSKDELMHACDTYVKSIHCLDHNLASCSPEQRGQVKIHFMHLRMTMDRICYDPPTHTSYLVYSGCLQKAYGRTEKCLHWFTRVLKNVTQRHQMDQLEQQRAAGSSGESTAAGVPFRDSNPSHFQHICLGLRHLITCIHNAVPCDETSQRDIKEILTLMIRGGVPSQMYLQCRIGAADQHNAKNRIPSSSSPRPPDTLTYIHRMAIVSALFISAIL